MAALNNDIVISIQDGGLGRLAPGEDWKSGIIFQSATKPTAYGTASIKRCYSVADAEGYGITVALFPSIHYHVSEYFRVLAQLNVNGWLDVGIFNIGTGTYDGTEIKTMQNNANGQLRQIGVRLIDAFASGQVTASQIKAAELDVENKPCVVVLAADFANFTAPTDLRTLASKLVSVVIAQDGGGVGSALFTATGISEGAIGACLGTLAAARVHENIGWVEKFNIAGATELQTLALCDGSLISAKSNTEIDALATAGYILAIPRHVSGSYWYDSPTATTATSDYAYIETNRVAQKAKRLSLQYLAPHQNRPLYVNPTTGKLTEETIAIFKNAILQALQNMIQSPSEINVDPATGRLPQNTVSIDPDQNVLSTSKVNIVVKISPVGVARQIAVTLSYAVTF